MGGYIGFLDLLGTSDLAQFDVRQYYRSLETFRNTIETVHRTSREDVEVFAFSDCAYISARRIKSLLDYVAQVRSHLLALELYLKGGIAEGELDGRPGGKDRFHSIQFGPDAVKAYALQEAMKGVGIRVADHLYGERSTVDRSSSRLVSSCYLPEGSHSPIESFQDIAFSLADCEYADRLVKTMHRLRIRSARIARYYIPPLVSMIRSSDFSRMLRLEDTPLVEDAAAGNLPKIGRIILEGDLVPLESKVPGIEQVYGAFLDEVCAQVPRQSRARHRVFKFLNRERWLAQLKHVPESVLGMSARQELAEFVSIEKSQRKRDKLRGDNA